MERKEIWPAIELELRKAKKKHPNWPDHIVARAGIVCEEAGELMRASLQYKYEHGKNEPVEKQIDSMKKEAIQTAATCIRFLENLNNLNNERFQNDTAERDPRGSQPATQVL
jgi:hypothetical protein